jgi:UDP-glucose 4-epimerase
LSWIVGDLQDPDVCQQIVAGCDVMVHLAHSSVPLSTAKNWVDQSLGSLRGSLNLLQALSESDSGRVPKMVMISSGGTVYRPKTPSAPFVETDPCEPSSVYGIEKLSIEQHLRLLAQQGKVRSVVLRVANAYGKLLPVSRKQGLIGTALSQALAGDDIRVIGSLSNVRDYIHMDDVCGAIVKSIAYDSEYEVFNIGTGIGCSVREIIEHLQRLLGRSLRLVDETQQSAPLPTYSVLNIEKAERLMGWKPQIELETGIRMTAGIGSQMR